MKKRTMHRAICLVAAAAMSCSPLLNFSGMGISAAAAEETEDENALVSVIVTVQGDAVLATEEGAAQGADYLDTEQAAQLSDALAAIQEEVQNGIRGFYPQLEIKYSYDVLINGFACEVPEKLIPLIERLPRVESVSRVENRSVPMMASASVLGGFPSYYDATGCTGEGQVIAIIDSELDISNPMFSAIDDKKVALKKEDIVKVATEVGLNVDIDPEKAYISSKLPYVIDYVDDPYTGFTDITSYHGTHVSGIAAGNEVTDYNGKKIAGVARDAQIIFMAVGAGGSGISDDAAIAATEDAIKLHADVINMSFGASGDVLENYPLYDLYETARNAGIIICKSAGNSGNTESGMPNSPNNPDVSTLDAFKEGAGIMSIASADNIYTEHYRAFMLGDEKIPYTEYYLPESGMKPYYLADILPEKEYEIYNAGDGMDLMMAIMMSQMNMPEEPLETTPAPEQENAEVFAEADATTAAPAATTAAATTAAPASSTAAATTAASAATTAAATTAAPAVTTAAATTAAPASTTAAATTAAPASTTAAATTAAPASTTTVSETTAATETSIVPETYSEEMNPIDISAIDLKDKILFVQAGYADIMSILDFAKQQGAAGAIIGYLEGEIATGQQLDLGLPYALVNFEDGQKITASAETKIRFTDETVDIDLPTKVSSYSSWGVHESLELRPDIMGIGGNVESAAYYEGQAVMSGTSMAAPYLTGCTALMTQYLKKKGVELNGADKFDYVRNLMMNTAIPYQEDNMFVTPRRQGAGFVSLNNALSGKVLMTGKEGAAKINLYDQLGDSFTFPVTLTNYSNEDVKFKSARLVLTTDNAVEDEQYGLIISGQQPLTASADLSKLVTVKAGEQRTENVTVKLDPAQTADITKAFTNGFFVEGYLLLEGAENASDISIPVLGFHGDWAAIPIFGEGSIAAIGLGRNSMPCGKSLMNTIAKVEEILERANPEDFETMSLDDIIYTYMTDEDYNTMFSLEPGTCYVSPNGDGLADNLSYMVMLERYAKLHGLDILDANGNVLSEGIDISLPIKGMGFQLSSTNTLPELGLAEGEYTAVAKASIAYPSSEKNPQTEELKFTVDNTAPVIKTSVREEKGRRILTITSNDTDLDGIFVTGTGKGGIVGQYDPKAENVNYQQALMCAECATTLFSVFVGEPAAVDSMDSLSLFAKVIGGYTREEEMIDIDFSDIITADSAKDGKFSVDYDITDLKSYCFTAVDRALNMSVYETEAPAAQSITPGIWENQNRVFAFTEKDGGCALFSDGSRSDFTYTLKDGTAELVFADKKLRAKVQQMNSQMLRLTWENGEVEVLYYVGEGTLDDFTFYSLAEIKEKVLQHYQETYSAMINFEVTRCEIVLTPGDIAKVSIYVDYNGTEMLLGYYQVDIHTGEGEDIIGSPFSMTGKSAAEALRTGIWMSVGEKAESAGYYWFDGDHSGTYRAFSDGASTNFTYTINGSTLYILMDGSTQPIQAQMRVIDDNRIVLIMDTHHGEILIFKSENTFKEFGFYTMNELIDMAKKDYQKKNGTVPANANVIIDENGTVSIILTDAYNKQLDSYTIDPTTGIGTNTTGAAVNLPQTGNNNAQPMTVAVLAFLLTAAGALAMAKSGMLRKKDEQI